MDTSGKRTPKESSQRKFERRNSRLDVEDAESMGGDSWLETNTSTSMSKGTSGSRRSWREKMKKSQKKKQRKKSGKAKTLGSSKSLREIREGRKKIESLLSGLVPNVDLKMMDKARVVTIDLQDFEDMEYAEAKAYLDQYRRTYAKEMDRYLSMKGNPYYKERMNALTALYEAEIRKLEDSIARRPECILESNKVHESNIERWSSWEEDNAKANTSALKTMRAALDYDPETSQSLYSLISDLGVDEVLGMGYDMDLLDRLVEIPVLKFCVMDEGEIMKVHPYDFVNRYRFKGLVGGYELDVTELRAIYASTPSMEKDLDENNARRREWRESLRTFLAERIRLQLAGKLDLVEERNTVYWDYSKVTTMEKLLKLRVSRERYDQLKKQLPLDEQETLTKMEKVLNQTLNLLDTSKKRKKLQAAIEMITGWTPKERMRRDMLKAQLEELDQVQNRRATNKLIHLEQENPLYKDLMEVMYSWD